MRKTTIAFLHVWTLTICAAALAESHFADVSVGAGSLRLSLASLQRQTGMELLFDSAVVNGLKSPAVEGKLSEEDALRALLTETELTVRRANSGAWIIEPREAPLVSQPDAPIPEILVTGQRTQNADIRRLENDIQPYDIVTQTELRRAHRDDLDQYFASRITANTTVIPSAWSQDADVLSSIDLRGLGSEATLVLIDGRRMPGIPATLTGFRQGDLNGIPLHAIERVEVLTGTAGGIHGFGALGGVVNVVLDRDRNGFDMHYTQGLSSRGDAGRRAVEASFGHTSDDGRTSFSLFGGYTESEPFLGGERGFSMRDRNANLPRYAAADWLFQAEFGNSVGIYNLSDGNLVLKPEYGGTMLGSNYTFLPVGSASNALETGRSLVRNAGQLDTSVSPGEANNDLGTTPRSDSVLLNLRHKFSERAEVYADAVILRSRGEYHGRDQTGQALIAPESPISPFTDRVIATYPIDGFDHWQTNSYESTRYTAGLLVELPFAWRGTAEASWGAIRHATKDVSEVALDTEFVDFVGDPSDVERSIFGDWDTFQASIGTNRGEFSTESALSNRFRAYSLRLAGRLFETRAGPSTLTLLGEHRTERLPSYSDYRAIALGGPPIYQEFTEPARSTATNSAYAELRSPLSRILELQLAVRYDERKDNFEVSPVDTDADIVHARFSGTAYTAGASFSPTSWLMLRGSYATGVEPPLLEALLEGTPLEAGSNYVSDPKRVNSEPEDIYVFGYLQGGNSRLRTQRARTDFWGIVLTPSGVDGPRIALDYSRIRRTRDVIELLPQAVMDGEDLWPERVGRAPLTEEDRAKGYTAGRITLLDTRLGNDGTLEVDSIDARVDWPLEFSGGRLRLYADATYHLRNTKTAPVQEDEERAGWLHGPLKRRANGGFDWTKNSLTLGANLQYFGRYLILAQGQLTGNNELYELMQGSTHISSQRYLDIYASWRATVRNFGPLSDLTVDLGVINALDKAPPRESSFIDAGSGYSRYGDPRMRRFELSVSAHF